MKSQPRVKPTGLFDVQYAAFLKTVSHLRARLHRYCTRMVGSAMDGEDIMQEALFEAYRKVDQLEDPGALQGWLFRIAHNRCIDFLRNRKARERAEANYAEEEIILPVEPTGFGAGRAIERLVIHLPPKERACVLLKDVFDYSLEEIAELVDSTVGGVKSALNRGRTKLAFLPAQPSAPVAIVAPDPQLSRLLNRYVNLFNQRDWDGVRALASADARLRVSDCFNGLLVDSPYFLEFDRAQTPWRIDIGEVESETVLIVLFEKHDGWMPTYPVRVHVRDGLIDAITDYYACPWLLPAADNVRVNGRPIFDKVERGS
ncbi:sigma-70 family RNA polymerase sigma factor [Rhizobium miluonense]|uniref:RNA polymerase sigma-70 factor, ECF subfamily n=1 Tax=Rhizobium miluonense TaxID=411945 RepID=A0A1C3U7A6_9HYPH|nr:sigma-70 family RNA polymerase sigma factor [Rhizobium miluonense]SCB11285.1 RNA polymerase sigma-70 factor, ECF subfamily [Rhizobium miluonense]